MTKAKKLKTYIMMWSGGGKKFFLLVLLIISTIGSGAFIPRSVKNRSLSVSMNFGFIYTPKVSNKPKLILVSGT